MQAAYSAGCRTHTAALRTLRHFHPLHTSSVRCALLLLGLESLAHAAACINRRFHTPRKVVLGALHLRRHPS
jgi:hypothetical protein